MSHHVTHASVQAWLDAYMHAWETYDAADVEPLFTEDAEYRYHPADEPEVGRELDRLRLAEPEWRREPPRQARHLRGRPEAVRRGWQSRRRGRDVHLLDGRHPLDGVPHLLQQLAARVRRRMASCSSFTEYYMVPRAS